MAQQQISNEWSLPVSWLEQKVVVQLNLPIADKNGQLTFPQMEGTLLEDGTGFVRLRLTTGPGQPAVLEEVLPKHNIWSVRKASAIVR